jgi:hypothetical protein
MRKLGVEISESKTHVSPNTYEFAKRWIHRKVEVSPLPLRGILSNLNKPLVVLQELMIYMNRNNVLFQGTSLELISKIYNNLKIGRRTYRSNTVHQICYDFYYILRYAFDNLTNIEMRQYLISKKVPDIFICREELIPSFMRELLTMELSSQAEKLAFSLLNM